MRRLSWFLLLAFALVGCSGEDDQRAQGLLERARVAESNVRSASFSATLSVAAEGQRFSIVLEGGGYRRGPRAGEGFLQMRGGDGLPVPLDFAVVMRGGRAHLRMGGTWRSFALTARTGGVASSSADAGALVRELTRHVKDVSVTDGVVNGESGWTIAGTIDTAGLVEAAAGLAPLSEAAGQRFDAGRLRDLVGDTRAVLFVCARTGLIRSAVVTLSLEAEGRSAELRFTYRLAGVNRPVAIPRVA